MSTVIVEVKRSLTRTIALIQARGPRGSDGKDGTGSQILYGEGVPSPDFAQNEDTYIDTLSGNFYRKEAGEWIYRTNMLGPHGWSPIFAAVTSGTKRLFKLVDWIGGDPASVKPPIQDGGQDQYVGTTGFTTNPANAQDFLGPWGWSPIYAAMPDSIRVVFQLVDYVGGTGTKPSVLSGGNAQYLGTTGLVTNIANATNMRGLQGNEGWDPVLANETDGQRVVQKVVDWINGGGAKPIVPSDSYLGPTGFTDKAGATDIRGSQGYKGWEPVYANVLDGLRVVQQLVDWQGGAGSKPAVPASTYIGATGLVTNIADATDIRGPSGFGASGEDVSIEPTATILSTNAQEAIYELDAKKLARDHLIGIGFPYAASADVSVPPGFLLCDGRNVSRTTYAKLFAKIGQIWGGGDGSTTFGLPDWRGRTLFGRDRATTRISTYLGDYVGAVGGSQFMQTHTHTVSATTGTESADHSHAFSGTTSWGGDHAHAGAQITDVGSSNSGTGKQAYERTSTTTGVAGAHNHTYSGQTGGRSAAHTHSFSTTSAGPNVTAGSSGNIPPAATVDWLIYAGV